MKTTSTSRFVMRTAVMLLGGVLAAGLAGAAGGAPAGGERASAKKAPATTKKAATPRKAAKASQVRGRQAPRAVQPSRFEGEYRARAMKVGAIGDNLGLKSNVALVIDQTTGELVFSKNVDDVHPIASITKLMTALVILDAQLPLAERVDITAEDIDTERGSRSRLKIGAEFSRDDLLHLALMSSENRAAHALGRSYPGGMAAFVEAMNAKAFALGMGRTRFVDPTGLSSANVSTAADLVKLVHETHRQPLIRQYSTSPNHQVTIAGRPARFNNTNRLVSSETWDIGLSKTGFINEAGRCLVMQAKIQGRPLVIVLLDSWGKLSRIGDANRIKKWLTSSVQSGALPG